MYIHTCSSSADEEQVCIYIYIYDFFFLKIFWLPCSSILTIHICIHIDMYVHTCSSSVYIYVY